MRLAVGEGAERTMSAGRIDEEEAASKSNAGGSGEALALAGEAFFFLLALDREGEAAVASASCGSEAAALASVFKSIACTDFRLSARSPEHSSSTLSQGQRLP